MFISFRIYTIFKALLFTVENNTIMENFHLVYVGRTFVMWSDILNIGICNTYTVTILIAFMEIE